MGWLTTETAEDIQRALNNGTAIDSFIANLQGASLPGLVEYGCVHWANNDNTIIPPLPHAISTSELGCALRAVQSKLGLRSEGFQKPAVRNIDARSCEFMVLRSETDLTSQEWSLFQARFNRSARTIGFPGGTSNCLQAAFHEMAENAILHSESPVPALVGYYVEAEVAQFTVADAGIGVLASLRTCSAYKHLRFDNEAIREALCDGTSRWGPMKGGFGFREVFRSLTAHWGHLRFRSGEGCVIMDGTDLDVDRGYQHFPPFLPGFQLTVTCQTNHNTLPARLL